MPTPLLLARPPSGYGWDSQTGETADAVLTDPMTVGKSAERVHTSEDLQIAMQQLIPLLANNMAKMEVTNAEVLRVTEAHCAFQKCGAALCVRHDGDFYSKSCKSQKISTFWSHSWKGGRWNKFLTLITFYNAPAALCCGFLTAILMMILFSVQILPGLDRGYLFDFSAWCLCPAVLVTALFMILWRSQSLVFLDRICIKQNDNDLKTQAILSLAGLLKNSDVMLVLWDPTWTERLWCLFELAVFLKSKNMNGKKQLLIVRPIFLGPISIALFLVVVALGLPILIVPFPSSEASAGFPLVTGFASTYGIAFFCATAVGYAMVMSIRNYFRQLDVMKQQLLSVSFGTTRSSCCELNHKSSSGAPLLCDRQVLKECLNIWFGNQEAFEQSVRSEVLDILKDVLSEKVFSRTWILSVTSPLIWVFMDLSATLTQVEHGTLAFLTTMWQGLVLWLLAIPSFKDLLIMICRLTRAKQRNAYMEALKNLLVTFLCFVQVFILIALFALTRFVNTAWEGPHKSFATEQLARAKVERAAAWTGCSLVYSICSSLLVSLPCLHNFKTVLSESGSDPNRNNST